MCGAEITGFGLDFDSHSFSIKDLTTLTPSSSNEASYEFHKLDKQKFESSLKENKEKLVPCRIFAVKALETQIAF